MIKVYINISEDGLLPEGFSVFDMPDYWELFKGPEDPGKGCFALTAKANQEKEERKLGR
jgi:hypothetical protein